MTFHYQTFTNGLKVLIEEIPTSYSVASGLFVKVGSGYEAEKNAGLAHFLEHLSFKGTKKRTAFEIAQAIDRVGGRLNAFTSKETTGFYAVVRDKHFKLAMDVLSDLYLNSLFEPREINLEKNVVLEEIKMYEDTPDEQIHDLLLEIGWSHHPMGRSTLGNSQTVADFSRAEVVEFYKKHYYPANTLIAVAGGVKIKQVLKEIVRLFKNFKNDQKDVFVKAPVFKPAIKYKNKKTEQVHLCLGVKTPNILDEKRYPLSLLNTILGGSTSSRLFQEIREKRGLVYSVSSYLGLFANAGILGIYAGTSLENFKQVVDLVIKEFNKLKKECSSEELEDAKEQIKGNFVLGLESPASRMNWFAKSILYYDRIITIEETFRAIDKVTLDEVIDLAEQLLMPSKSVLVAIGPFFKKKSKISSLKF